MWADIAKAARMQVGELGAVCTLMSLALFGGGWWQINTGSQIKLANGGYQRALQF